MAYTPTYSRPTRTPEEQAEWDRKYKIIADERAAYDARPQGGPQGYVPGSNYYDSADDNEPLQQRLQALLPKPDPEMDDRWRAAENTALDRSTEPQYGVAEGVRDFAPMAVGGLLDILVNKGRGLGTLAAGGMQALSAESSRRDAARTQAAKEAMAMRGQRGEDAGLKTNAYHALLRGEELQQRIDEQRAKRGTPQEEADARQAGLEHTRAETAELQARAKHSGVDEVLRLMGINDKTVSDAAKQVLAERIATAKEEANKLKAEEQRTAAEEKKALAAEKTRTENSAKFNKATEKLVPFAVALRTADDAIARVRSKDPHADLPGTGLTGRVPFEALTPEGKTIRNVKDNVKDFLARSQSGKAIPPKEREALERMIEPGASDESFEVGFKLWKRLVTGQLRQHAKAYSDVARDLLEANEEGLYDYVQNPFPAAPEGPILYDGRGGQPAPDQPAPEQPGPQALPTRTPPPSAAPATPPAIPPGDGAEYRALMGKVPPDQRQAVNDRLAALPPEQRLPELRRLANGGRPAPAAPATETPTPSAAPAKSKFDSRRRRGGTP